MNPTNKPPDTTLTAADRADLVTARQTALRAASGEPDADLDAAALLIDRVLARSCAHDPAGYIVGTDNGRELATCVACGISWYLP